AENGIVVEDMTETSSVETTENLAVQKVELVADSFSTFTIYCGYNSQRSVTVHYVYTDGNEIQGTRTRNVNFSNGTNAILSNYANASGYNYQGAHLNSING